MKKINIFIEKLNVEAVPGVLVVCAALVLCPPPRGVWPCPRTREGSPGQPPCASSSSQSSATLAWGSGPLWIGRPLLHFAGLALSPAQGSGLCALCPQARGLHDAVSAERCHAVLFQQEEEGEDSDMPSGPQGASHKLPSAPAWHHFPSRYADVGCTGLRDAHEENPESILDEHVQRVMRTPGCQSPGPGHRSPDSAHVPKIGVLGGAMPGHGKHAPKLGAKLDPTGLHLHRHGHHHGHHGAARPKEPAEAEAARRVPGSFAWGPELHGHAAKPRSHVESTGAPPAGGDGLAYG